MTMPLALNTVHQGDCLELMRDIPDGSVDMVLTDIPYGEVVQQSSGLRLLDRGDADRCDIDLGRLCEQFVRIAIGSIYIFCGTEQISTLVGHLRRTGLTTRVGVWEKTNPSPMNGKRLWISGLEFCVFARKPNAYFSEHCKKAIWRSASGRAKTHPTEKPISIMERLIIASCPNGGTVLDCCAGSGTTGVAARNCGRNFILIEREPKYVEVIRNRLWPVEDDCLDCLE